MARQVLTGFRAFSRFECWVNEMVKEMDSRLWICQFWDWCVPSPAWRRTLETEVSRDRLRFGSWQCGGPHPDSPKLGVCVCFQFLAPHSGSALYLWVPTLFKLIRPLDCVQGCSFKKKKVKRIMKLSCLLSKRFTDRAFSPALPCA